MFTTWYRDQRKRLFNFQRKFWACRFAYGSRYFVRLVITCLCYRMTPWVFVNRPTPTIGATIVPNRFVSKWATSRILLLIPEAKCQNDTLPLWQFACGVFPEVWRFATGRVCLRGRFTRYTHTHATHTTPALHMSRHAIRDTHSACLYTHIMWYVYIPHTHTPPHHTPPAHHIIYDVMWPACHTWGEGADNYHL